MDNDTRNEQLAAEQSSEWLERLKSPKRGDEAEFVSWLKRSPLNVREILFATALDRASRAVDRRHAIDVQRLRLRVVAGIITLPASHASSRRSRTNSTGASGARAWKLAAGIAALAVTALGILAVEGAGRAQSMVTEAGEWKQTRLEDGSVVHLGPRSRLRIAMSARQRRIELKQGEALFEVAKDANRPFIVATQRAEAHALGTVFAVSRLPDHVLVTVKEGRVAVRRTGAFLLHTPSVKLRAGHQVAVSDAVTPLQVKPVDVATELAWTQGRLVFTHTTVAQAAEAFNRHNRLQIHITDRELAARSIGGIFRAADPESFVQLLLTSRYGRGVVRTDAPGFVRLAPRVAEKSSASRAE